MFLRRHIGLPRANRGRTGGKPGFDPFDFPRKPRRAGKTRKVRKPHNRPPLRRRRMRML